MRFDGGLPCNAEGSMVRSGKYDYSRLTVLAFSPQFADDNGAHTL